LNTVKTRQLQFTVTLAGWLVGWWLVSRVTCLSALYIDRRLVFPTRWISAAAAAAAENQRVGKTRRHCLY